MAKRKQPRLTAPTAPHHNPSADWTRTPHAKVHGRLLEPGTEVGIYGEEGRRFRFHQAVTTPSGASWLDFWESDGGGSRYRSFKVDKVRVVHRVVKTRKNLEKLAA